MSGTRKGLDPLVECSENPDSHDFVPSEDGESADSVYKESHHLKARKTSFSDALEVLIEEESHQATTSKSTETVTAQAKNKAVDVGRPFGSSKRDHLEPKEEDGVSSQSGQSVQSQLPGRQGLLPRTVSQTIPPVSRVTPLLPYSIMANITWKYVSPEIKV